jgi:hypothetical protein
VLHLRLLPIEIMPLMTAMNDASAPTSGAEKLVTAPILAGARVVVSSGVEATRTPGIPREPDLPAGNGGGGWAP